jgi:hypothetical protein
MNHIPIPPQGYSLEQLAALAIDQAVQIHIGVHKEDVAANPPVITIQASSKQPDAVEAFRMVLDTADPQMNLKLSGTLAQMIQRVIRGRLVLPGIHIVKP